MVWGAPACNHGYGMISSVVRTAAAGLQLALRSSSLQPPQAGVPRISHEVW
jgi:hypothetical protein